MDYLALKAEFANDPAGLGYAPYWADGTDWKLAELINAVSPSISINRGVVPSYEVVNATVTAEWSALSAAEKQRYQTIVGAGYVDFGNPNVRAAFQQMFGAGTGTRAALLAAVVRNGSRAEQVVGQSVSVADVSQARAS